MSSGFISEAEIQARREVRQKEWEKVRTEDQPLEAPEPEPHDGRTLFDRLQEQKDKKQEEWDESRKFKNQIKNLDEDECSFLDLVDKTKTDQQQKIRNDDNKELEEFRPSTATSRAALSSATNHLATEDDNFDRKAQASAEEQAEERRIQAEVQRAPPAAAAAAASRPASARPTQSQLVAGVVKRKSREPAAEQTAEKKTRRDSSPEPERRPTGAVTLPSALRCVGVLPGVGVYTDSSDSDSDASSDVSWPKRQQAAASSAGTADSHKGHGCGGAANCKT